MKIAIDLRLVYSNPDFYSRGLGTYLKGLIPHLIKFHRPIFLLDKKIANFRKEYNYSDVHELEYVPMISKRSLIFQGFILPSKLIFKYDLVHFLFHEIGPFCPFYRKYLVTVHDIIPIKFSQFSHQKGAKQNIFKWQSYKILNYARKIITVSECTKKDVIETFGINEKKIHAIHSGLNFKLEKVDLTKEDAKKALLEKFDWANKPFLFYAGGFDRRKNILELIVELVKNKKFMTSEYVFVLGGRIPPYGIFSEIAEYIFSRNLQRKIIFTGHLTEDDLIKFYTIADILIFPSLYEGFGFPVLEAMAMGLPVCALRNSCMPEIMGSNYPLYNSLKELVEATMQIVFDQKEKENLARIGRERSKLFSWENAAKEYLDIYESHI